MRKSVIKGRSPEILIAAEKQTRVYRGVSPDILIANIEERNKGA
jgi:hypothetical protein